VRQSYETSACESYMTIVQITNTSSIADGSRGTQIEISFVTMINRSEPPNSRHT